MDFEFFKVEIDGRGIAQVTFERPPVNAVSNQVYLEIGALSDMVNASDEIKVVILAGSAKSRAWCGGVELRDVGALDKEGRKKRYELLRDTLPRFYALDRPVIAALEGHAVGIGFIIASLCDIRVASDEAFFAFPEIDRGLVAAGGGTQVRISFPGGKLREMIYTGRRYMAEELRDTGFFNYIVPRQEVMPKAMELAEMIAGKGLPAIKANKVCNNAAEYTTWEESYNIGNDLNTELVDGTREAISAFFEKRAAGPGK